MGNERDGRRGGNRGWFFSLYCFHVLCKQLLLQGEGRKRRGERKAKAVGLEWDNWIVILFMIMMRGQWPLTFFVFIFACVKKLMVVALMGIYCPLGQH